MALPMSSMLSATGLPDPRQNLREDLMRMYGYYILSGPKTTEPVVTPVSSSASTEPGWGDITPAEDEEEEISEDKGQIVEVDEDEEEATAPAQPLDAADEELEAAAEEAAEEPVSGADTYESEILKLLQEARGKLLQPKKLSIADILGAGTMRRSAQLIGETEKLNEERQMKAQELALDILMRKSKIEKEREAAQALADYRKRMLEVRMASAQKGPQDPTQVRADRIAAIAMFPNLSEDQAYAKYLREVKYRTPPGREPRPEDYRIRMGKLIAQQEAAKKNQGPPVTPAEAAEIEQYKKQLNFLELVASVAFSNKPK